MFTVRLLGTLRLETSDGPVTGEASQRHRLALIALLAAAPDGTLSRDKLVGLLWPERDEAHARQLLNLAVHHLRRVLGPDAIRSAGPNLSLDPDTVRSDLQGFDAALEAGDMERAAERYGGPFLDGFHLPNAPSFDEWLDHERAGIRERYARALREAALAAEAGTQWGEATRWWRQAARLEPFDARTAMHLVRAMADGGDRTGAAHQANVAIAALRAEEIEPDPALLALADELREAPPPPEPVEVDLPRAAAQSTDEGGTPRAPAHPGDRTIDPTAAVTVLDAAPTRPRRRTRAAAVVVTLAFLTFAGWFALRSATATTILQVAILPIQDLSGQDGALADGIHDALIGAVAAEEVVDVLARSAVMPYRGSDLTTREIARQLRADAILEATVFRGGDRLRINVNLVEPETLRHLWSRSYDRSVGNPLDTQRDLVLAIVPEVRRALQAPGRRSPPPGPVVPRVIAQGADHYGEPVYSPDGTRLAYVVARRGRSAVWVAAASGADAVQISPPARMVYQLDWSPDGREVAYLTDVDGRPNVAVVPAAGGEPRILTRDAGGKDKLRWAPDGTRLLYSSTAWGPTGALYTVAADGRGRPEILLADSAVDMSGIWSPDGSRIAMLRQHGGTRNVVWILNVADGSTRALTTEGDEWPVDWSPDGRELLISSDRTGTFDLWVWPQDGRPPRQLTNDVRNDGPTAAFSPDGRWVAYMGDRGGQWDIWIVPSGGGESIRVTDDPAVEQPFNPPSAASLRPAWTGDGTGLTFVRLEGTQQIWIQHLDSAVARQLTTERRGASEPIVSPRSNLVAYRGGEPWTSNIAVVDPRTGAQRTLTEGLTRHFGATWSPDGARLAYTSGEGGGYDLWITAASGGAPTQLTRMGGWPTGAAWSPDGTTIAFGSDRDSRDRDIWTVAAAGGQPTRITRIGGAHFPRWSPDGRQLAVRLTSGGVRQLGVVAATGGTPTVIGQGRSDSDPQWSPDGRLIAFTHGGRAGEAIAVVAPDGSGFRLLTSPETGDRMPVWSPDGSRLAFETRRNGNGDIAVLTLATGRIQMVTDGPEHESRPAWTPDGRAVVFQRDGRRSQLVTANIASLLRRQ